MSLFQTLRAFVLPLGFLHLAVSPPARAQEVKLKVNIFAGPQNIALFVAQERGFFAKRGLAVETIFTPTSQAQRDGIADGTFQIAQAGVDNAVFLVDVTKVDTIIVAGGGNGMNDLIVRPEIMSFEDIRGKTVVVDAPNTAYAFLLYKMLALKGLERGSYEVLPKGSATLRLQMMREDLDNVAAMLNPPYNFIGEKGGFKNLGPGVGVVGAYQADGVWVLRSWAKANADTLVKYLQANLEGMRWAKQSANHAEAAVIVGKKLNIDADLAMCSVRATVGPDGGLADHLRFDWEGFRNTLKLRAEMTGQPAGSIPPADRYVDLSYYEQAIR